MNCNRWCIPVISLALSAGLVSGNETAAPAKTEDLANERFYTDPLLLQKQWRVDCRQAVLTTGAWLDSYSQQSDWEQLPWRDLELCGLLFNTPDTGRHQPCPDYSKAFVSLRNARETGQKPGRVEMALSEHCDK